MEAAKNAVKSATGNDSQFEAGTHLQAFLPQAPC